MIPDNSEWTKYQRRRWTRSNAKLYLRPDPRLYLQPNQKLYFKPQPYELKNSAEIATELDIAAELDELLRLKRELAAIKFELKFQRLLHACKYSPNQPRVPAGSREGGQWISDGSAGRNDPQVISDAMHEGVKPGARYAEASRSRDYPVDLREEEARGGHAIAEHVGKGPDYLSERVRREAAAIVKRGDDFRGLAVGSFSSLESANRLVNSTLAQNQATVDQVARGERAAALLTSRFGSVTGSEAYLRSYNSQPYMRDTYGVSVVISRDLRSENGFRVQSAFPRY